MVPVPFYGLLPSYVQRVLNAAMGVLGAWLLSMATIPPGGEGDFVFLFIGGILLVMGLIGVVAPDRLVPRDIGEQS